MGINILVYKYINNFIVELQSYFPDCKIEISESDDDSIILFYYYEPNDEFCDISSGLLDKYFYNNGYNNIGFSRGAING